MNYSRDDFKISFRKNDVQFFVNDMYGFFNWSRLRKEQNP